MLMGSEYLKTLTRYGLDARILQDYKSYGMIYVSHRNNYGTADISKFVDYEGVDRKIINDVKKLENLADIEVFHIIWNSSSEILLMYHDNTYHIKTQLEKFKRGECNTYKYNIKTGDTRYYCVKYEVLLGAIVDIDYKINM